ncbi:MAG: hypothetical protein KBE41_09255 [Lutibacter sp.]|nr:hypothetical protein [Lutibacter sp.]
MKDGRFTLIGGRFKVNNGNKVMIGGSLIVNESCFTLIYGRFTLMHGS